MNKQLIKDLASGCGGLHYDPLNETGTVALKNASAVECFASKVVDECTKLVKEIDRHHCITTYDEQLVTATLQKVLDKINKRFEL